MTDDDAVVRALAAMWRDRDPVPVALVDKALVAIETQHLDAEYALLHLVERSQELAGTRGMGEAFTIAFSGGAFSLLLRVSELGDKSCRVDGWVSPPQQMRVNVTQQSGSFHATVDMLGRFEIAKLPTGLTRFWLHSDDGEEAERSFATPPFDL